MKRKISYSTPEEKKAYIDRIDRYLLENKTTVAKAAHALGVEAWRYYNFKNFFKKAIEAGSKTPTGKRVLTFSIPDEIDQMLTELALKNDIPPEIVAKLIFNDSVRAKVKLLNGKKE
jgi:hypothetical protein